MSVLRASKITQKLTWLQVTLIVGFLVIGLAYFAVVKVVYDATDRTAQLTGFELMMADAKAEMLQARRREKDFLLRFDPKYLEQHEIAMQSMFRDLNEASALAPSQEARTTVEEVRKFAEAYQQSFRQAADTQTKLGLDEKTGQHGSMRQAVHEVESLVNEFNDAELKSSMLMMRRHEKDFIQREKVKYVRRMGAEQENFNNLLALSDLTDEAKENVVNLMAAYYATFKDFAAGTDQVNADIAVFRDAVHQTEPLLDSAVQLATEIAEVNQVQTESTTELITAAFAIVGLLVAGITLLSLTRLSRGISSSLKRLTGTVKKVVEGDYTARAGLTGKDELTELGNAFDGMLADRVSILAEAEAENNKLNNSVIELMEAVAELSSRDLTVKAPVAEDVTGAVADAVNMMASETARVLKEIRNIAGDVSAAADAVRDQGQKVSEVAKSESQIVHDTRHKLEDASQTMNDIATLAGECNEIGARASDYTSKALDTVAKTASGMADVRETISESEKRVKRLGERSQEISAVVDIINNIAERTQVLALNASMQAAAAGDAGRGFAVVADEVQRLAESSRQSTSEIEALVRNIQAETSNAMATMNRTIEQVVEGAELADQAGREMDATQKTADELVKGVRQIAERSTMQAKVSGELEQQAGILQEGNSKTDRELGEQAKHTESLAEFSRRLVESVSVFRLPA